MTRRTRRRHLAALALSGLALLAPGPAAGERDLPPDPSRVTLGRRLFFDPVLSSTRTISCASCHRPEHAFADRVPVSAGVHGRLGTRNAPALVNRAGAPFFFWDGRETTLEGQVLQPIQHPLEMDLPLDRMVERLAADTVYRAAFARSFADGVTAANAAAALAAYVRTIRSTASPYDRFLAGDERALEPEARRGFDLFHGRAGCAGCHAAPDLTDEAFHNTGVSWGTADVGRQSITAGERDCGAFKTPTLREVARTAPYMHDGSLPTLAAVVDFYRRGGRLNPCLDARVRPIELTPDEAKAIEAFLASLVGTVTEGMGGGR